MTSVDGSSDVLEKKQHDVDVTEKSNGSVTSEAGEDDVTTEEERRLLRRLDRRIMSIICLMYLGDCLSHHFPAVKFS